MTIKEASELQEHIEALATEHSRVQQDIQQRLELRARLSAVRQETALTAVKEEVQTALANLTPKNLMARLTDQIETLVKERLTV